VTAFLFPYDWIKGLNHPWRFSQLTIRPT
jgi:hypothetical protein